MPEDKPKIKFYKCPACGAEAFYQIPGEGQLPFWEKYMCANCGYIEWYYGGRLVDIGTHWRHAYSPPG